MLYISTALRAAFAKYRQSRYYHLDHTIRRTRSAQLRALLADPSRIDLDTFNREVWRIGSPVTFDGITTALYGVHRHKPTDEWLTAFERAIQDGSVQLHGNCTWKPGTAVFDTSGADDADKLQRVRDAIDILNSTMLPAEKERRIEDLDGFGPTSASGLVMLFHPDEYAMFVDLSKTGIAPPHYERATFQGTARELKATHGAQDYLDLDNFLFLIQQGIIPSDEVAEARVTLSQQSIPPRTGQGFQSDVALRRAVEQHAIERAIRHYQSLGWTVEDVSRSKPYDLHCTKGSQSLRVEVKGTSSNGAQVLVTRNEVLHAWKHAPRVALFILARIGVTPSPSGDPEASGGEPIILEPWRVDEAALTALAYTYAVPTHTARRAR